MIMQIIGRYHSSGQGSYWSQQRHGRTPRHQDHAARLIGGTNHAACHHQTRFRQVGAAEQKLAEGVTQAVMTSLGLGAESVSVSLEEIEPSEWTEKVYTPDIINGPGKLYKQPGYKPQ
jgi:4-oxalocrotonate tautomerase